MFGSDCGNGNNIPSLPKIGHVNFVEVTFLLINVVTSYQVSEVNSEARVIGQALCPLQIIKKTQTPTASDSKSGTHRFTLNDISNTVKIALEKFMLVIKCNNKYFKILSYANVGEANFLYVCDCIETNTPTHED